ncbi:MAG: TonB-dependent receptor, partial [Arenicella sp.]|nr:TonB-dependent receptor [Arenicella sp.]
TDLGFTFNAPVSETFAVRGSLDRLDDDGFIDYPYVVRQIGVSNPDPDFNNPADRAANFNPVEDANTEEVTSGRLALRWQPNDIVDATLTYYFQDAEYGGRSTTTLRSQVPSGEYEFGGRVVEPNERDSDLIALEITADLGFAELTSATGIASVEENGQRDQTDLLISLEYSYETFPTFTAFTFEDEETDIFNQEIRLVSTGDGPLSWIVGAFYNKNEYNALSSEFTPGYGAFTGFRTDLNDLEYFEGDRTDLEETAFFGEIAYQINDYWDVTFGARIYDYEYQTANLTEFPYFSDPSFVPFPLSDIEGQLILEPNQEFDDQLFKVNTSYTFDNGNLVYATFSQGFRVGASNGGSSCPDIFVPGPQGLCLLSPGQQFGPNPGDVAQINELEFTPDTVDNYEIGVKSTLLDGSLNLNAAIFYMDWKDPQVASASVNAGTSITVNAGAAETKGFEVSANWQASDQWSLSANVSYADAELTEDVASLVTSIAPPGFGTIFEDGRSGDQLPGSPKSQFSFFAEYEHPLNNGASLLFNTAYSWQDEVLSFAGARGNSYTLPSFGRANIALGYHTDYWSVTGYVDNLFDDFSESSASNTPLFNQTVAGANVRRFRTNVLPPRTLGVRFKYDFE